MARLARVELSPAREGDSQSEPEVEVAIPYIPTSSDIPSALDGNEDNSEDGAAEKGLADVLNRESLSGSGRKEMRKDVETEHATAERRGTNSLFGGFPAWLWGSSQKRPAAAMVDESNISRKRVSAAVFPSDRTLSTPTPGPSVSVPTDMQMRRFPQAKLSRPACIYQDIGPTVRKPQSQGRPDPYAIEDSPQKAADTTTEANRETRKSNIARVAKETVNGMAQGQNAAMEHNEEPQPEEVQKPDDGKRGTKRATSTRIADNLPNKRTTRSRPHDTLLVPEDYSKVPERTISNRNAAAEEVLDLVDLVNQKSTRGQLREDGRSTRNTETVDVESLEEELSSPARTPEKISGETAPETTRIGLPFGSGNQGEASGIEKEAVTGIPISPSLVKTKKNSKPSAPMPKKPDTIKKRPILQPAAFTKLPVRPPENGKSRARKRRKGNLSFEPFKKDRQSKKKKRPVIPDEQEYQEELRVRTEQMKKNTALRDYRRRIGLPVVGSQESLAHALGKKSHLPNSSQARAPSNSQQPSGAELATGSRQQSNPQNTGSETLLSSPDINRTLQLPLSLNWQEVHEKELRNRLRLQAKDAYFKRERAALGLPPIGSQQSLARSLSRQPSRFNSSRPRTPSSSQLLDPPSSSQNEFSNSTPSSSRARQIQRELAAIEEEERAVLDKKARLQRALELVKKAEAQRGEPIDADERLHMFGGGTSPASKPKKWSQSEMGVLINGLKDHQGPDRYEKIRLSLPDRNYDEIFDQAKYFKETMVERYRERWQNDVFSEFRPLEEFIRSIGLESQTFR